MVAQNPGGHPGHPPPWVAPLNANIMMLNSMIGISTCANNYDISEVPKDKLSTSQSNEHLNIEKLILDPLPSPPKGAPHQTVYNPNASVSQH